MSNKHPFRRVIFRGLALIMPPLLTIVILLWAWSMIDTYVLTPFEGGLRRAIVFSISEIEEFDSKEVAAKDGFVKVSGQNKYVPEDVFQKVQEYPGPEGVPATARGVYERYVNIMYLNWYQVVPFFLVGLIMILYFLGKFLAAGIGRFFWNLFDGIIHRVPIIRNVYGAMKQVTDFLFGEHEMEYSRVVAVEYPRRGVWSIGFVTGESMKGISEATGEPVLSVLMPTSPMPATGFTITVRQSETIDLNITVDQAIQFVVSCGVVVPPHQLKLQQEENEA